jgi:hypothetical protein
LKRHTCHDGQIVPHQPWRRWRPTRVCHMQSKTSNHDQENT